MTDEQPRMANPFGMDEACPNCPELVEARSAVCHGYGDVTAEFLFITERPAECDIPSSSALMGRASESHVDILETLEFLDVRHTPPRLENAFLTHLTRCRHPDRRPTDREITTCEPFLNAEVRSINPEILIPVGQRVLEEIVAEYTTTDPATVSIEELHATEVRGRGFELIPMVADDRLTPERVEEFIDAMESTMTRDYRQTKGRQGR